MILLNFTFVLNCCLVSCVYRSCCSTAVTSAFKEQDFLFFLGYNFQSGLGVSDVLLSLCLYHTYMVTSALWKWWKAFLPTQRVFHYIFGSNSARGIKKHGDEVFYSSYFLWRTQSGMHTHLGNGRIFLVAIMIISQQLSVNVVEMNGSWSKEPSNGILEDQKNKKRKKNVPLFYQIYLGSTFFWMFDSINEFILWDFQKVTLLLKIIAEDVIPCTKVQRGTRYYSSLLSYSAHRKHWLGFLNLHLVWFF